MREQDRTEEAVPVLKPLVESDNPYQQRSLVALAEVYMKQREYDRADVLFDRYLEGLGCGYAGRILRLAQSGGRGAGELRGCAPDGLESAFRTVLDGARPRPRDGRE